MAEMEVGRGRSLVTTLIHMTTVPVISRYISSHYTDGKMEVGRGRSLCHYTDSYNHNTCYQQLQNLMLVLAERQSWDYMEPGLVIHTASVGTAQLVNHTAV